MMNVNKLILKIVLDTIRIKDFNLDNILIDEK